MCEEALMSPRGRSGLLAEQVNRALGKLKGRLSWSHPGGDFLLSWYCCSQQLPKSSSVETDDDVCETVKPHLFL